MKLLLTPVGPSDKVIKWIPRVDGLIPNKHHVRVLVCNDGKDTAFCKFSFDRSYYERLFTKLCKNHEAVVQTVSLETISFFEADIDFFEKLNNADVFFMSGFTSHVNHVEAIFKRDDEAMTLKRAALANAVVTNQVTMWAVCGSAVCCGNSWGIGWSGRGLQASEFQMFDMLNDGCIDYQACSGASGIEVTDDLKAFHITSGTGLVIVLNAEQRHGEAFVCVNKSWAAYQAKCDLITAKTNRQLMRLSAMVSVYRSRPAKDSQRWCFRWGTGIVEWL